MAGVRVPALDFAAQIVDPRTGALTTYGDAFFRALLNRTGGAADKVEAASAAAARAVRQGTELVAVGGLQGGGAIGDNVGLTLYAAICAVAQLPSDGLQEGDWAYAVDGQKPGEATGAGTGVPVFLSGGNRYSACSGAVAIA